MAVGLFGSAVTDAGMSYNTQCTQVVFGALGSGASGSSTMSAKLFVPAGTPRQLEGRGEILAVAGVFLGNVPVRRERG